MNDRTVRRSLGWLVLALAGCARGAPPPTSAGPSATSVRAVSTAAARPTDHVPSAQPERWLGTYIVTESCPTEAGTPGLTFHRLVLRRVSDALVAEWTASGYQRIEHVLGKVKLDGGSAIILFDQLGSDDAMHAGYAAGSTLSTNFPIASAYQGANRGRMHTRCG